MRPNTKNSSLIFFFANFEKWFPKYYGLFLFNHKQIMIVLAVWVGNDYCISPYPESGPEKYGERGNGVPRKVGTYQEV